MRPMKILRLQRRVDILNMLILFIYIWGCILLLHKSNSVADNLLIACDTVVSFIKKLPFSCLFHELWSVYDSLRLLKTNIFFNEIIKYAAASVHHNLWCDELIGELLPPGDDVDYVILLH